jgi:hypothetical protein
MRLKRINRADPNKDDFKIRDVEAKEIQNELRDIIRDNYRDDDTFSEARVDETLLGIVAGYYKAMIDIDPNSYELILHIEVEYELGDLDIRILEVLEIMV